MIALLVASRTLEGRGIYFVEQVTILTSSGDSFLSIGGWFLEISEQVEYLFRFRERCFGA